MINNNKISIVIPCYNEEGNINILYKQINDTLSDYLIEYVFVDDNSNDETLDILKDLAQTDPRVKYVSFSRNFGHQSALRAGLEYATGDCVISMDADLQHPPQLLQKLITTWKQGYDIVYTIRKDIDNISLYKKITSSFFYKVINYGSR